MRIPPIEVHMHEELALRWNGQEYREGIVAIARKDTAGFECTWRYEKLPSPVLSAHRRRAGDALVEVKRQVDKQLDALCECGDALHHHGRLGNVGPCCYGDNDMESMGCCCTEFKERKR